MTDYCQICGEPLESDEEEKGVCSNCKNTKSEKETKSFDPNDVSYQ